MNMLVAFALTDNFGFLARGDNETSTVAHTGDA